MKAIIKYVIAGSVFVVVNIALNGCKSKPMVNETAGRVATDTVSAVTAIDSEQIVVAKDSVVSRAPLTLVITNLADINGPVIVGLYGIKNKFPDPTGRMKVYTFKTHGKELTAKIANLAFGTYAIAIYQDVNSNGKIDKNLIGIPTEPYAFSDNYKPTVKAPCFNNCKFDYGATDNTITMNMIR